MDQIQYVVKLIFCYKVPVSGWKRFSIPRVQILGGPEICKSRWYIAMQATKGYIPAKYVGEVKIIFSKGRQKLQIILEEKILKCWLSFFFEWKYKLESVSSIPHNLSTRKVQLTIYNFTPILSWKLTLSQFDQSTNHLGRDWMPAYAWTKLLGCSYQSFRPGLAHANRPRRPSPRETKMSFPMT